VRRTGFDESQDQARIVVTRGGLDERYLDVPIVGEVRKAA
jgi:hypothetical protein